jgi:cellulose synthase/poly-beta-1,6-N-acetylglucosamine synthase-like glycosyltransferase
MTPCSEWYPRNLYVGGFAVHEDHITASGAPDHRKWPQPRSLGCGQQVDPQTARPTAQSLLVARERPGEGRRPSQVGEPAAVGKVVVAVPSHNEESKIGATIESLLSQTRRPDEIVIICDNCTDATGSVAATYPVRVTETRNNQHKKAGALNQELERLLVELRPEDAILVMDADSVLEPAFLETAIERLSRGDVNAVGGTFTGQSGGGLVGMFQRNEYARYARDVGRLKGKVLVLTGTATVFRVSALREVRQARLEGRLPGGTGQVYDTRVLTEDNELTLALLHLGHRIISPKGCRLTTEVMPTWRALARQRRRWKRGALENLFDYGWTPVTRRYWGRQLLSLIGVIVTFIYLATIVSSLVIDGWIALRPLWLIVTLIFSLERVVTVRSRGAVQMLLSSVLVVEMVYDVFLQGVQAQAFRDSILGQERRW